MYRCKEDSHAELEIKKSRFITYLHPCFDEKSAKEFILKIKKKHPNATHHCYAFVIGEHNEIQRNNDDGEPGGTAGVPMMECLLHRKMQDIVAVTVRYFGGIKLGAGGLVRAYSKSVSHALDEAVLTEKVLMNKCSLKLPYDLIGKINYFFRSHGLEVLDTAYEEHVTYTFLCKEVPTIELSQLTSGTAIPEVLEQVIIDQPVHSN